MKNLLDLDWDPKLVWQRLHQTVPSLYGIITQAFQLTGTAKVTNSWHYQKCIIWLSLYCLNQCNKRCASELWTLSCASSLFFSIKEDPMNKINFQARSLYHICNVFAGQQMTFLLQRSHLFLSIASFQMTIRLDNLHNWVRPTSNIGKYCLWRPSFSCLFHFDKRCVHLPGSSYSCLTNNTPVLLDYIMPIYLYWSENWSN